MRKRAKGSFADPRQNQMEGGEGGMEKREHCSVYVCVEASIFRGLKCGRKTSMILCLLTKRPHYRLPLSPYHTLSELHIVQEHS